MNRSLRSPQPWLLLGALALAPALAACSSDGSSSGSSQSSGGNGAIALTATDTSCQPARDEVPAGAVTFAVTNKGSRITEAEIFGQDGDQFTKVISEVENIGPGTSRNLAVTLPAGTYELACKPGQSGNGIRTRLTVTGGAGAASTPSPRSPSASGTSESGAAREIELSTDGTRISGETGSARTGERVQVELTNHASSPRTLEIKNASGAVVAESSSIAPNAKGEVTVRLSTSGNWQLVAEGDGVPDRVATLTVR
jgi:uncharacterized cupredoxin-like copper-binding protein